MEGFLKYINIADTVDVMIFKNNNQSITLTSSVYEVVNDNLLIISNPILEGILYPMERQYTYYFRFFIENNGMYLFKGIMLERLAYDNLPSVKIQLESEIKRVQRRKFYRVSFFSKGNFLFEREMTGDEKQKIATNKVLKLANTVEIIKENYVVERIAFETKNLSGGGLGVESSREFELEEIVYGEFIINNYTIKFKGEITRVQKKDNKRFEVGIKFIELDSNMQSKIIAYVFEIERNLIKKGLM